MAKVEAEVTDEESKLAIGKAKVRYSHMPTIVSIIPYATHTHTHIQHYPGGSVPEETFTHSHPS